jgi:hypothetical protein
MTAKTTLSRIRWGAGMAGVCLLTAAVAQPKVDFSDPTIHRHRITVGARFAFNISADLRHVSASPTLPPYYDDGYVLPDMNGGSSTWNWGYLYDAQNQPPFVAQHIMDSTLRDGTSSDMSPKEPQTGFEILYGHELLRTPLGEKRVLILGVEGGFTSLDVNFEQRDRVSGPVNYRTDRYDASGILVPKAPYFGSYDLVGPLLPRTPAQTLSDTPTAISDLNAQLDTLVLGFKLGGFAELPLWRTLSFRVSVGAAIMDVLTELRYTESFYHASTGALLATHSAKENTSEWLFGFYGQAALNVALSDYLSLYVGGQFQGLSDTSIRTGSEEATLNLDSSIEAIVGMSMSF